MFRGLRTKVHRLQRKLDYAAKPNPELVWKRQKLEKLKEGLSQVLSAATLNFVLGQIRVATAKTMDRDGHLKIRH